MDVKIEMWDMVGKPIFFLGNNQIMTQVLTKITVEKYQGNGSSIHTSVTYHCGANTPKEVFRSRLECADYWLKQNKIDFKLSEVD